MGGEQEGCGLGELVVSCLLRRIDLQLHLRHIHVTPPQFATSQGKLVSAMMKKHLVESVVPLLCELKHLLQVGG